MKPHLVKLFIAFALVQCAHQSNKTPLDPWTARSAVFPKRFIFLAVEGLDSAMLTQGTYALLKSRGALAPKTELGLLYSVPAIDLAVSQTGSSPKTLSIGDHVYRDARGKLGPKGQLYPISSLTRNQWNRVLGARKGLHTTLKNLGGATYVVAPSSTLANAWGVPSADGIRYPKRPDPNWAGEEMIRVVQGDPNWRAVFGMVPKESGDKVLSQLLKHVETHNLQSETLIIVCGINASVSRVVIGEKQDRELLQIEPNEMSAVVYDKTIRIWAKEPSRLKLAGLATRLEQIPSVVDVYQKENTGSSVHYIRTYRNPELPEPVRAWAESKHQILVEDVASASSADLVVVLQQTPSELPFLLWAPNLKQNPSATPPPLRLVDIPASVSRFMGMPQPEDEERLSSPIDPYIQD